MKRDCGMNNIQNKNIATSLLPIIIFSLSFLTACGGGSSSTPTPPPPPQNMAPTVSVTDFSLPENTTGSVTATATDSDGSISTYAWVQKSGPSVVLSNTDTATVSVDAPEVTADTDIVLTITVTDDDGAMSSADVTATITANILSFTVSGLVTDSPVADANVEFKIDGQSFTTIADANGEYSIVINIDDSYLDKIIEAIATGPEANSPLKLVSLLGSVDTIIEAAGADGILTKDELFDVNITNFSTAIAVLMVQANNDLPVNDSSTFLLASNSIDVGSLLPYAIAVKLVLDFSANEPSLALPAGFTDTLLLLQDKIQIGIYIDNAFTNFDISYNQASSDMLADNNIVNSQINESQIASPSNYFFYNPTNSIVIPKRSRMTLNPDNSGTLFEEEGSSGFTWSLNENVISVVFPGVGFVEGLLNSSFVAQRVSSNRSLILLHRTPSNDIFIINNTTFTHYPNGEIADSSPTFTSTIVNAAKQEAILDASNILQMNMSYTLPIVDLKLQVQSPQTDNIPPLTRVQDMIFSGDVNQGGTVTITTPEIFGDGSIINSQTNQNWEIDASGNLQITGAKSYEYSFILDNQGKTPVVNVLQSENGTDRSISGVAYLKEVNSLVSEDVVGIYQAPRNFADQTSLRYFWIEINNDNTSLRVSVADFNNDGILSADEFSLWNSQWDFNSTGNLVVRRYYIESSNQKCIPSTFEPLPSDTCVLWGEREWDVHQNQANGDFYVKQLFRLFDDVSRQSYPDPKPQGHILLLSTIQNRYFKKLSERPITIPPEAFSSGNIQKVPMLNSVQSKINLTKTIQKEIERETYQ